VAHESSHTGVAVDRVRTTALCSSIPRRIIQTGPSQLPLLLSSAIQNVRLLHPTFEYLFFDDAQAESFVQNHFPEYRRVYHSFRFPIQKYDFFRYLAVYRLGGFYLDLDVFLAKDLTPLLTAQCVFPFEELSGIEYLWKQFRMDWQIGNYAFGAAAGHPFLAAIIENCLQARADSSWVAPMMKWIPRPFHQEFYVLNTTGPGMVSRTFAENPEMAPTINILFPDDVRNHRTWHQFGNFGVHHMAGSWRGPQDLISLRLLRLWDAWTLRRVLSNARNRGKTREHTPHMCGTGD
jgi:inositol phosphorylceramide mannosyltransferase catalytic subunit